MNAGKMLNSMNLSLWFGVQWKMPIWILKILTVPEKVFTRAQMSRPFFVL